MSAAEASADPPAADPVVSLPDTSGFEQNAFTIPVRTTDLTGEAVTAYQFTLFYEPSVLTIEDADATNTLSASGNVTVNASEGEIRVAFATNEPLEGQGTLLKLTAQLRGSGQSILALSELRLFDEDGQEVDVTPESGTLTVAPDTDPPTPPTDLALTTEDTNVTLSWTASASSDVARQLIYRGTTADFDTSGALLESTDPSTTTTTDAGLAPGPYFYRLAAVDGAGNTSALSDSVGALSVQISRSFGDASSEDNYALVALPGQANRSLENTLSGTAGTDWQAWWDNGSDDNFLVPFDGSDAFTFAPGRGFWLISTSDWSVESTFPAADRTNGATTISLHSGWNIISNPLAHDVSWTAVENANAGPLQTLWAWDGGFTEATTFQSAASGEAYYFLNDQGLDELVIPTDEAAASVQAPAPSTEEVLTIQTRQNGRVTSAIRVGFNPAAEASLDAFDQFAPPSRFSPAHLHLKAPGSPASARRQYLAHEWRPPTSEGHRFKLVLYRSSNAPVDLEVAGLGALDGRSAALIDKAAGRTYDLRTQNTVRLHPDQDSTALELVIGSSAFVDEAAQNARPEALTLHPSYPNPFAAQTTLAYALPEATEVRITVYDIVGRQVRVLADHAKPAGRHRIQWNGRNQSGQPVASGLYLVRLEALGQQHTQKITRVR